MFKRIKLKQHKRLAIAIGVLILVAIVGGYLILRPKEDGVRYVTTTAAKSSLSVTVTGSGTLVPASVQNAGFRTAGKITEIDVKVGDHVTVGQTLAKIDSTQLQNQLTQSQSALTQAQNNLSNKYLSRGYTTYDIQSLQAAINSAQAKVNNDQDNLNSATLTSTVDGIVVHISNSVGDSVSGSGSNGTYSTSNNNSVMTVINMNSLQADLSVNETDIHSVAVGQVVQLAFDALSGKTYVGKIAKIDLLPTISSNVVSYDVKVSIDKVDSDLKPGMTANATVLVNTKDNVIAVPNSAVKTVSGQKTVQILKDGQPLSVAVTTGLIGDTDTEITSGINEGDEVITNTITGSSNTTRTQTSSGFGGLGGGAGRITTRF